MYLLSSFGTDRFVWVCHFHGEARAQEQEWKYLGFLGPTVRNSTPLLLPNSVGQRDFHDQTEINRERNQIHLFSITAKSQAEGVHIGRGEELELLIQSIA